MGKRTVVLTGANRGLGRRTAEILIEKFSEGFTYIFTERSKNHDVLRSEFLRINPNADFEIKDLNITIKESRDTFIKWFVGKYKTLDVLFNNSGVHDEIDDGRRPTKKISEFTFNVNFFGTVEFTEEFFPYISEDGKIIEHSSFVGKLESQPEGARQYLEGDNITKEKLYKLAHDFINYSDDQSKDLIFNQFVYITTKAFLNAYVRYVAIKYVKPNQSLFAVNPGWVQTDLGGSNAPLTVDQSCPYLASIVAEYPFGRHPLHGKLIHQHKDIGY